MKPGSQGGREPVSYTHLDVYKRQQYTARNLQTPSNS